MATVPTTPDHVPGDKIDSAYLNARVRDALDFLLQPPAVGVLGSNGAVPNATLTLMSFSSELFDTDGMWAGGNPSRIQINTDGLYELIVLQRWAPNTTGTNQLQLRLNASGSSTGGSAIITTGEPGGPTYDTSVPLTWLVSLASGDHVEVFSRQSSGANLAVSVWAFARWIGRA